MLAAMMIAAIVGIWGLRAYPVPSDDLFLGLVEARTPLVFNVLVYGYATLWPRWTSQNRPLVDRSKPATTFVATETERDC